MNQNWPILRTYENEFCAASRFQLAGLELAEFLVERQARGLPEAQEKTEKLNGKFWAANFGCARLACATGAGRLEIAAKMLAVPRFEMEKEIR